MKCPNARLLAQWKSGELAVSDCEDLERHVRSCAACAKVEQDLEIITSAIKEGVAVDQAALTERVLSAMRAAPRARGRGLRLTPVWSFRARVAAGAVASLVVLSLGVWGGLDVREPSRALEAEFKSRGNSTRDQGERFRSDRFVSVEVFRLDEGPPRSYRPSGRSLSSNEALAFQVSNPPATGFGFLYLFAISENSEVFWYYPTRQEVLSTSGRGGKIRTASTAFPLRDQVRYVLPAGRLRLIGVFSVQPQTLETIEATVKDMLRTEPDLARWTRLPLEDTGQHAQMFEVASPASLEGMHR